MSTSSTLIKNVRTLIAEGTVNAAGSGFTRGAVDLRTASGGFLTIKIQNLSVGPSTAAKARILISHNAGATPTLSGQGTGTGWKLVETFNSSTTALATHEYYWEVPVGVMHLQVEVTGNVSQNIQCDAYLSEVTSILNTTV